MKKIMKLNKKTTDNLKKVSVELPRLAEESKDIVRDFDMSWFGCYSFHSKDSVINNKCDTYGCLLGNMARCFDISNSKYYDEKNRFSYQNFLKEEFPSIDWECVTFDYLFSAYWDSTNFKDFYSAIQRVYNLYNHGKKVKYFSYETNKILS